MKATSKENSASKPYKSLSHSKSICKYRVAFIFEGLNLAIFGKESCPKPHCMV